MWITVCTTTVGIPITEIVATTAITKPAATTTATATTPVIITTATAAATTTIGAATTTNQHNSSLQLYLVCYLLLVFQEDWRVEVRHVRLCHLEDQVVLAGVRHIAQGKNALGRSLVLPPAATSTVTSPKSAAPATAPRPPLSPPYSPPPPPRPP